MNLLSYAVRPSFTKARGMMSDNDSSKQEPSKKADSPQPDSSEPIIKHPVNADPEETLKHWTADKMRKAKPAPLPKVDKIDHGKKQRRRAPNTYDPKHS